MAKAKKGAEDTAPAAEPEIVVDIGTTGQEEELVLPGAPTIVAPQGDIGETWDEVVDAVDTHVDPELAAADKAFSEAVAPKTPLDTSYIDIACEQQVMSYAKNDPLTKLRRQFNDAISNPHRGDVVSTGILGADLCLFGGVTFGSIHEFYGLSKSGKTLLMCSTAKSAQRVNEDCIVVILDRENAYDVPRLLRLGLDPKRTIIIPARDIPTPTAAYEVMCNILYEIDGSAVMEEAFSKERDALRVKFTKEKDKAKGKTIQDKIKTLTNKIEKISELRKKAMASGFGRFFDTGYSPHVVFIIDSIPAFAEKQDMVEDQGRRAKMWHGILRRFTAVLDPKVMLLVSNHITYKPGTYGSGETKSTGVAVDYYRDCGIKCMGIHSIYDANGVHIGEMLGVEVDKTRRGISNAHTFFPVMRDGVNYYSGVLGYALYIGVAELANKTAYKDGKGKVFPKVRFGGHVLDESDPDFVNKLKGSGLLPAIRDRVGELF